VWVCCTPQRPVAYNNPTLGTIFIVHGAAQPPLQLLAR
jgi:hypothetical protein